MPTLDIGVQTTHGNLISCVAYNLERVNLTKDLFETKIQFSVAPWYHGMGFIGKLFATTSREITLAYLNKFDPDLYLGTIQVNITSFEVWLNFIQIFFFPKLEI